MAANLSIRTNPPALVEVHDAEYRQRDVGLSPRELKNVSKGRYVVSATMKNGQVIQKAIEIDADTNYWISLSPEDGSELRQAKDALYTRFINAMKTFTGYETEAPSLATAATSMAEIGGLKAAPLGSVPAVADSQRLPVFIRVFRLEDWGKAVPVTIPQLSGVYEDLTVRIDLQLKARTVLFVQIAAPGLIPLNVSVPAAGRLISTKCTLRVQFAMGEIAVRVEFESVSANACARLLELGDYERARQLATQDIPKDTSALTKFGQQFTQRLNDPTATLLSRYIRLRVGDLDWSNNLAFSLADVFDWMSDGAIISGELAARKGLHQQALTLLLRASDLSRHAPPLFTEGYKLLVSRLQQYSRPTGRLSTISEEDAAKAQAFLDKLDAYTPYLEVDPITVAFSGADLSNLEESQHPADLTGDDWFRWP